MLSMATFSKHPVHWLRNQYVFMNTRCCACSRNCGRRSWRRRRRTLRVWRASRSVCGRSSSRTSSSTRTRSVVTRRRSPHTRNDSAEFSRLLDEPTLNHTSKVTSLSSDALQKRGLCRRAMAGRLSVCHVRVLHRNG